MKDFTDKVYKADLLFDKFHMNRITHAELVMLVKVLLEDKACYLWCRMMLMMYNDHGMY